MKIFLLIMFISSFAIADIGFFICPYKSRLGAGGRKVRYCAMDDHTAAIKRGGWSESEILGDRAIVKVSDSKAVIDSITACTKLPLNDLKSSLNSITSEQLTSIHDEILDEGYSQEELDSAIPDLKSSTLETVLKFMATRRLQPRYDFVGDKIVLDGPVQPVKSIDILDKEVAP